MNLPIILSPMADREFEAAATWSIICTPRELLGEEGEPCATQTSRRS
jgi:hypothetical protein